MTNDKIIGFPHPPQVHGGPGSFQTRLTEELILRNWKIVYPEDSIRPDVILVVGGTKRIKWLKKCKKSGVRIVHRLDGLNWRHKIIKTSFKEKLLASSRNLIFKHIRNKLADEVIYQSSFIKDCWYKYSSKAPVPENIIYNAVNLDDFKPSENFSDKPDLICVEGRLQPHPATIDPLKEISNYLLSNKLISSVKVCGKTTPEIDKELKGIDGLKLVGVVPRDEIRNQLKSAVFLVLEIQPPCPNSVIEALASGCPVIGFRSGAIEELVDNSSGCIVEYGGDPWRLDIPKSENLITKMEEFFKNYKKFSIGARKRAEKKFCLDNMVNKYIEVLTRS